MAASAPARVHVRRVDERESDLERFLGRIQPDAGGCWLWAGGLNGYGYGQFSMGRGVNALAHRLSYALFAAPLKPGLTIDHLCRNRGCVNPDHLEQVTGVVNTLRGFGAPAQNARRDACVNGHLFTEENVYRRRDRNGGRECRECRRIRKRKGGKPDGR